MCFKILFSKLWLLSSTPVNVWEAGIDYEVGNVSYLYNFIETENFGWSNPCIVPEEVYELMQWTPPYLVVWNLVKHKHPSMLPHM